MISIYRSIRTINLYFSLSVITFLVLLNQVEHAQAVQFLSYKEHYQAKIDSGDILSLVLERCFPDQRHHLYGKHGLLAKIAALNPEIPSLDELQAAEEIRMFDLGPPQCTIIKKMSEKSEETLSPKRRKITTPTEEVALSAATIHTLYDDVLPIDCDAEEKELVSEASSASQEKPEVGKNVKDMKELKVALLPEFTKPTEPVKPIEPILEYKYPGWLSVMANFGYSRIDSIDVISNGHAMLLSNLNSGIHFMWQQDYTESIKTSIFLNFQQESYDVQTIQSSVNTDSHILTKFGARGDLYPFEDFRRLSLSSSLYFQQILYARALTINANVLDSIFVSNLAIGASYLLIERETLLISAVASGAILLPTITEGYSIPVGFNATLGARVVQPILRNCQLVGDFYYSYQTQSSSIADQTRKDVNLSLGLRFHFGAEVIPNK